MNEKNENKTHKIRKTICVQQKHIDMIEELKQNKYSNLSQSQIICLAIETLHKNKA